MAGAKAMPLDFTNTKDGGGNFRKIRQVAGEYRAKIVQVEDTKKKDGGDPMWLWTIKVGPGVYPYYTAFAENQLWKIRNLFVAAGIAVPKKRVNVNPNKIVGKDIGVILVDDDYDGKEQSSIDSVLPLSEISDDDSPAEPDEDEEETTEETADEDTGDDLESLDVDEL